IIEVGVVEEQMKFIDYPNVFYVIYSFYFLTIIGLQHQALAKDDILISLLDEISENFEVEKENTADFGVLKNISLQTKGTFVILDTILLLFEFLVYFLENEYASPFVCPLGNYISIYILNYISVDYISLDNSTTSRSYYASSRSFLSINLNTGHRMDLLLLMIKYKCARAMVTTYYYEPYRLGTSLTINVIICYFTKE
ncbi:hypothetical protein ACJX0J_025031, partial [Zea mays]